MRRSPSSGHLVAIVAFHLCSICGAGAADIKAQRGVLLAEFESYLRHAREGDFENSARVVLSYERGKSGIRNAGELSPDGRLIVVERGWFQWRRPTERGIEFYSLETGELLSAISSVSNHGLTVYPENYFWEPNCKHIWVQMCYTDGGYGDWAEFALDKMKFTEQGSEVINYMLSIPTDPAPDWTQSKPRTWPSPPVWSETGQRYDSYLEAEKAGVKRF
jgi:hypothetical protein